jgi:hypothetical protein
LMLSRMKNDIMLHFERHCSAQAVGMQWRQYGGTFTTRFR